MSTTATRLLGLALLALCFTGCSRQIEELQSEPVSGYLALEPGKYIIYRLDSTVFRDFGRTTKINSFQEKHLVDAQITDNLGRPSYRIFRYLRDTAGTTPWAPSGSFLVTAAADKVEWIEDNLRFVKLSKPVMQNFSWHGNNYLPAEPYGTYYHFDNDDYMADWEYYYEETGGTDIFNGTEVQQIITIRSADESANVPVTDNKLYGYINYAVDRFAKGIGLVEQELIMWEYQPSPSGNGDGAKTGFGVKRRMIEHN